PGTAPDNGSGMAAYPSSPLLSATQWTFLPPIRDTRARRQRNPGKYFRGSPAVFGRVVNMRGMTDHLSIGERIAWYRRRRGMSQEVLAGLVNRTPDWLSKVENDRIELDRLSVIKSLATALDVSIGDLLAEPSLVDWTAESGDRTVPALRA